jgi:hypothetical protein
MYFVAPAGMTVTVEERERERERDRSVRRYGLLPHTHLTE